MLNHIYNNTRNKRVLITGASSFMGAHACRFLSQYCHVIAAYHNNPIYLPNITSIRVDLTTSRSVRLLQSQNVDIVIHLASKIKSSPNGIPAYDCNRQMIKHLIQVEKPMIYCSSTAVHWNVDVPYVKSRLEDEDELQSSTIPYVILRPCAPYGPPLVFHKPTHKESFQTLLDVVRYAPIIPVIGDGKYRRQPVHVDDFCAMILYYIGKELDGSLLNVAGSKSYPFNSLISILKKALQKSTPLVHIPKKIALLGARTNIFPNLEESLLSVIDISEEFDVTPIHEHFISLGLHLRSFEEGFGDLLGYHQSK